MAERPERSDRPTWCPFCRNAGCDQCSDRPVRRYDGRTEHADWCSDRSHDGLCLDALAGWEPAPELVASTQRAIRRWDRIDDDPAEPQGEWPFGVHPEADDG